MPDRPRDVGAPLRLRLLNRAHASGHPIKLLRTPYALERVHQVLHGA
jgi:hypothetical protein